MRWYTPTSPAVVLALALGVGEVSAQRPTQPTTPAAQGSYREAVAFEGKSTIQTRRGPRAVRIVMKKLRIGSGGQSARVPLPEKGLVIFQHRAGELEMTIGQTRRKLFEGEWLTVTLPETVVVKTADDSVLIDAIIVAE